MNYVMCSDADPAQISWAQLTVLSDQYTNIINTINPH